MTDRELMQQALEALELLAWYENPATKVQVRKPRNGGPIVTMYPHKVATEAAAPLRERLAQPEQEPVFDCPRCGHCCPQRKPEQEPVVWMYQDKSTHEVRFQKHMRDFVDHGATYETPLYTTPPQRKPVLAEREACAALLDANAMACENPIYRSLLQANAQAIREMGQP